MSERNAAARRRLDLGADASSPPGAVINPYSSPSRATRSGKQKESSSAVTPEKVINEFLSSKKKVLPRTSRIITPDKKRKAIDLDGEEELYYSSGDEKKDAKLYKPTHIYANVGFHCRGDLALDQGKLKAYRFIRNHYLIPLTFETDRQFGPHSGSCFEERVITAYSLGKLELKDEYRGVVDESSLFVCSHCGDEGHKRDGCLELL